MSLYAVDDAIVACYERLNQPDDAAKWIKVRDGIGPMTWPSTVARRFHQTATTTRP